MSFENWNKFVKEQLALKEQRKANNTPPPQNKGQEVLSNGKEKEPIPRKSV